MTTTFNLIDDSGLTSPTGQVWVAGWINGGGSGLAVLQSDGTFGGSSPATVPFYLVSDVPTVTLSVATNGDDRLLFVASPTQPTALTVTNNNAIQYTQYPYSNPPGVAAPGPFDVFEFGMNAQDNVTAVSASA
jgi:hypothetical protein